MEKERKFRIQFEYTYIGYVEISLSDIKDILHDKDIKDDTMLKHYLTDFMQNDVDNYEGYSSEILTLITIDKYDEDVIKSGIELSDVNLYDISEIIEEDGQIVYTDF